MFQVTHPAHIEDCTSMEQEIRAAARATRRVRFGPDSIAIISSSARVCPDVLCQVLQGAGWRVEGEAMVAPGVRPDEVDTHFECTGCGHVTPNALGMDDNLCDVCWGWPWFVAEWT